MTASLDEARALIRAATAAIGPMRERMARFGNGFMSLNDAAWFRMKLAELRGFRMEAERLAKRVDYPEFIEWVEETRAVEVSMRRVEASMKPVLAN